MLDFSVRRVLSFYLSLFIAFSHVHAAEILGPNGLPIGSTSSTQDGRPEYPPSRETTRQGPVSECADRIAERRFRKTLVRPLAKLVARWFFAPCNGKTVRQDPKELLALAETEELEVRTQLGELILKGRAYIPKKDGPKKKWNDQVVVLYHPVGYHSGFMSNRVQFLLESGFAAVTVDFSSSGRSDHHGFNWGMKERLLDDIVSSVQAVHSRFPDANVGVMTFSLSAFVGLAGLPFCDHLIKAIVLENGPAKDIPKTFERFWHSYVPNKFFLMKWLAQLHRGGIDQKTIGIYEPLVDTFVHTAHGLLDITHWPIEHKYPIQARVLVLGSNEDEVIPFDEQKATLSHFGDNLVNPYEYEIFEGAPHLKIFTGANPRHNPRYKEVVTEFFKEQLIRKP